MSAAERAAGTLASAAASAPVALVTGSRSGIGRHLVEHFARQGWAVEGCSRGAPDWTLDGYTHHEADVTDEEQVKRMMASIWERHARLDVVVNNAGAASMNHALLMPVATARRIVDTNLVGTFLLSRESAKLMKRRRYGRIINIGSAVAHMRIAGEAVYSASKEAIVAFTEIFAREVASFGITCNVVGPGPIDTDMIRGVPKEKIQRILDRQAIHRVGTFADVAHVVDFFAHPCSGYVTGQVIHLGGP